MLPLVCLTDLFQSSFNVKPLKLFETFSFVKGLKIIIQIFGADKNQLFNSEWYFFIVALKL